VTELSLHTAPYVLAAPIQRAVAVASGGTVFIAGGMDSTGTTVGGVFTMNPRTGALHAAGSLPHAVHDAAGAMIGGSLYVFGGGSSSGTDSVQAFDPATGTGAVVGHLPTPLSDLQAATIGRTVYLVGGYDGTRPRPEIYATTTGTSFRVIAKLPTGLRYPAVTAVGSALIVAGGQSLSGPVNTVYAVDTTSGSVTTMGHLAVPAAHAAAFTLGATAYIAGGQNAAGDAMSGVAAVDPAAATVSAEPPLRRPLSLAAVANTKGQAWLIGGWRGVTLSQVLTTSLQRVPGASPQAVVASATPSATPSAVTGAAAVRPFAGLLLIADRGNNRLIVVNAHKQIVWTYPSPGLPAPTFRFYFPDDAFFVHGGHAIIVNEEENDLLAEIAYPSGRTLWTYGHAGVAGSAPGYVHQPDDLYPYPKGGVVVADAMNCRILFLGPGGHYARQIGNGSCVHGMPSTVGYPNGDTPLPDGDLLVSELDGSWVSRVTPQGVPIWQHHLPGLVEPSDPQRLADGTYLVASYASPGAVIRFDHQGEVLWYYHPTSGPGVLDHPSLAMPLPNGLVAVNDDDNHRVVLIDPATNTIVWQYGTGTPGTGPGQLAFPDGMDFMLPGNVLPMHVDFSSSTVHPGRP
jgi:outer membrane protein assembly factor BamB